jgi:hypothetical protein
MRRILLFAGLVLFLAPAGCSNAPVAGFLDNCFPSRARTNANADTNPTPGVDVRPNPDPIRPGPAPRPGPGPLPPPDFGPNP